MSAFHFSLEQVLRYRKQLEDQAMLVFAQAMQARDRRLADKRRYETELADARCRLADEGMLDADMRWLISGYMTALKQDLAKVDQDLVLLEEDVDRCRAELTQKAQERKLLEKLRDKQASRHMKMENYREQQNYDDIATIRFAPSAL